MVVASEYLGLLGKLMRQAVYRNRVLEELGGKCKGFAFYLYRTHFIVLRTKQDGNEEVRERNYSESDVVKNLASKGSGTAGSVY